ncbi:MAG: replication initiator [Rhodoglobus sp.]
MRRSNCARPYEAQPGVFVRCQSRRSAVCPSCAAQYRGDWQRLARSGMYDADAQPVKGFRYFFITLSAPSFGAVHRVPKPWDKARRRCACGSTHAPSEIELRGLPVALDGYDYVGQVAWHGAVSRLWASSVDAMRRRSPSMEYFVVREVQARMALHLHAVVRVPDHVPVSAAAMGAAARAATAAHPATGEVVSWGQKGVQDREIQPRRSQEEGVSPDMSTAAARVIGYVSKALNYSLKDIVPGQDAADSDPSPERFEFVRRLRHAARFQVRCKDCPSSGAADCSKRAHRSLGYGGHTVTMSRPTKRRPGWSFAHLTRKRIREERMAWAAAHWTADDASGIGDDEVWWARYAADMRARRAQEAWESRQHARAP